MPSPVRGDTGYTKMPEVAVTKLKSGMGETNNKKITQPNTSSQIEKGQGDNIQEGWRELRGASSGLGLGVLEVMSPQPLTGCSLHMARGPCSHLSQVTALKHIYLHSPNTPYMQGLV